jgi:hypothetical protein
MAKPLRQYKDLSRVPLFNHARSAFARTGRYNPLAMFKREALLPWLKGTWRFAIDHRWPFQAATAAPNRTSVYVVPNDLIISIAGDWGTGSNEAEVVGLQMQKSNAGGLPDITIHLGDVYYVGDSVELEQNCLGGTGQKERAKQDCVEWPHGKLGSFALQGNHEMYADGVAYFREFLPTLGMLDQIGAPRGQGASFFCLENDTWRVIGIDTGYNSVTQTPVLRLFQHGDCKLEGLLIDWLRNVVRPKQNPKATVIMSHHQYFSGFEKEEYPLPAQQLEEFFDSPVIWFWGHEHRFSGYKLFGSKKLQVHGRCIGHGGMPIESNKLMDNAAGQQWLFYDTRVNQLYANDEDRFGFNGFAQLEFHDNKMTAEYQSLSVAPVGSGERYKPDPDLLRTETFDWDGSNLTLSNVANYQTDKGFMVRP